MLKLYLQISYPTNRIQEILNNSEKILAYNLTDGLHTAREISQKIGYSIGTINRWWREWLNRGLVSEYYENNKRHIKKNFLLSDFGIEIPEMNYKYKDVLLTKIPDKYELKYMLFDKNMFLNNIDLKNFTINVLNINFDAKIYNKEELIEIIINNFYQSSKRKQLMFMQALKQRAKDHQSPFLNYFEEWEKRIKSEI